MNDPGSKAAIAQEEEDLRAALGARIRRARKRARLSGRKLAALAGITPAAISQIELGQVTPSISTLLRIAHALQLHIADLFDATQPSPDRVLGPEDWDVFQYPDRSFEDAVLSADPEERLGVGWTRLAPGATLDNEGLADRALAQFVFVLSGEIEIQIGDEIHVLGERSCITFSGDSLRRWRNPAASEPAEFLWAVTPSVY